MEAKRVNWSLTIVLMICSLAILFPLYLTIVTAFKSPGDMSKSLLSLPSHLQWSNFADAIRLTNFFHSFQNSFIVTIFTVSLTLLTNSFVAYAIARNMHKRVFKFLYFYFVSAMFVPFPIIMLPVVKQTSLFGLNNMTGLIFLYIVYGLAFNIFIYVGYIRSIPKSLEEAAYVDGASTWTVFWKVIFPLLAPINATIGILTCLWAWNDFLLPLVILSDRNSMTLPLVQYVFQSQFTTNYNLAFASYLMALSPMILVYIIAQKWIISGVTRGAVK